MSNVTKLINSLTIKELSDSEFRALCLKTKTSDRLLEVVYNEKVRREYKRQAELLKSKHSCTHFEVELVAYKTEPVENSKMYRVTKKKVGSKTEIISLDDFPKYKFDLESERMFRPEGQVWKIKKLRAA